MKPGRAATIAFALALLARGALLLSAEGGPGRPLEGDERGYAAAAGSLARGEGFGFTIAGMLPGGLLEQRRLEAFRAPLLPAVLAPVHLVSGGDPAALRWACVLLGALAAPLALLVAARLGGPGAGWIAGVAVALWPSHAWLSARVLSEPLDAVLLLAGGDLLMRHRPLAGGAAMGLAVLCRPGGLLAALLAAGAGACSEERGRRLRPFLLSALAIAAVVAPWAVRNARLFGEPVIVTTSGVTLAGGNCAASLAAEHPGKWVPPERAWPGPDGPDMGMYGWSHLGEAESSARFGSMAREWVAANPGDAAILACWKVIRFLDPDTRSAGPDAFEKALAGWLSWAPLLLVVLLAGAGRIWRWEPEAQVASALLLGHLLAAIVAYGDARMRAPVEPALIALLAAPWLAGLSGPRMGKPTPPPATLGR